MTCTSILLVPSTFLAKDLFQCENYTLQSQVADFKISFVLASTSLLIDGEWKKHSTELPLALRWSNTS